MRMTIPLQKPSFVLGVIIAFIVSAYIGIAGFYWLRGDEMLILDPTTRQWTLYLGLTLSTLFLIASIWDIQKCNKQPKAYDFQIHPAFNEKGVFFAILGFLLLVTQLLGTLRTYSYGPQGERVREAGESILSPEGVMHVEYDLFPSTFCGFLGVVLLFGAYLPWIWRNVRKQLPSIAIDAEQFVYHYTINQQSTIRWNDISKFEYKGNLITGFLNVQSPNQKVEIDTAPFRVQDLQHLLDQLQIRISPNAWNVHIEGPHAQWESVPA